jgi:hypothetical protein
MEDNSVKRMLKEESERMKKKRIDTEREKIPKMLP